MSPETTDHLRALVLLNRDPTNPGFTGGDLVTWQCAQYLADRGHEVLILTSRHAGASKSETIGKLPVVRLGRLHTLWLRTFLYYIRHCKGRFDVVLVDGFGGSRVPRLAPLYVKEPIVTEWHQVHHDLFLAQYPKLMVPLLDLLERLTARVHRDTLLVARTEQGKLAFHKLGFKPENVVVVPVAIDEDWLKQDELGNVRAPRLVWLGKFRRYKCPDHAISAMSRVVKTVPDARLVLAGRHDDLRYERRLQEMVRAMNLSNNVEFHFDISEDQKRSLLKSCRGMVLPSSIEGFGIVVLEANACGVPVIASTGVPTGSVQADRNGLRYPFGNIEALADEILSLITDDLLYRRLSQGGIEFAKSFAYPVVFKEYEAVIRRAASRRRAA